MRVAGSAVFVFIASVAVVAGPAAAQDADVIEVTPYVAIGTAAAPPVGVAVTFPVTSSLSVETDLAYRRGEGEMNALSSSLSLLQHLPSLGRARPYIVAGVGLGQYGAPVFGASGPPIGTESRVALTMNAGGGVKTALNDRVDLRTDARWLKSFGRYGTEQFRVAQGLSFGVRR